MNNLKPLKTEKDGLFSQNIPMKRSVIITENVLFLDLNMSTSTIRPSQRRRTQIFENTKSSAILNNVTYPTHSFLAKKLKRILQSHLRKVFQKIKSQRKIIINLNLLSSKAKRFLSTSFFTLKLYSQEHKGQKIQQTILRNRRPHLIYQSVSRVVKKNQKIVLQKLVNLTRRKKYHDQFVFRLELLIKNYTKIYFKKLFLKKIQNLYYKSTQKIEAAQIIFRLLPKIILDIKTSIFQKIIFCLKSVNLDNINSAKKEVFTKINESNAEKVKAIVLQRQQIKKIKSNLDDYSSDRTKARYEIRRDLNQQRNRIKQEEKKAKTTISDLTKQTMYLQSQLNQLKTINSKRLTKIKSSITQQTVKNLYLLISQQEPNKLGQIKMKRQIRQQNVTYQQQLENIDEYHIFLNQKLRQQVFQYENIQALKTRWPQQQLIYEQNKTLKQLIGCIIYRSLDNMANINKIKQLNN